MDLHFLLVWLDTPICWINCNPVNDLPDNIPRQKLDASLPFDLLLEMYETVLEFLGSIKLCLDFLLCFFLLITLLKLIAE